MPNQTSPNFNPDMKIAHKIEPAQTRTFAFGSPGGKCKVCALGGLM